MSYRIMRIRFLSALALLGCFAVAGNAMAAARIAGCFGNNMVLQREIKVPVWGSAAPGEKITVNFAGQTRETTADADGRWRVDLDPMPANNKPAVLVVKAGNTITVKNVLVGDVWVCSGQSNMAMRVNGCLDWKKEAAKADLPDIRQMRLGCQAAPRPLNDRHASWTVCSPRSVGGFTAAGFFFARKLYQELKIPIGLLYTNWGGTRIEPWTPPAGFQTVPQLKRIADKIAAWDPATEKGKQAFAAALKKMAEWLPRAEAALQAGRPFPPQPMLPGGAGNRGQPTHLYNAMIHPLLPYAIRGVIWYQGEANGGEGMSYFYKMQALIRGWRKVWGQGDFPFYFVQLANYQAPNNRPGCGNGWARVREAQRKSLTIPNTGMAVIIDIGLANNIHPKNKQDVGLRLALWALAKTYGRKNLVCSGPLYRGCKVEGGAMRIEFDYVGSGLMVGEKIGLAPTREVPDGKLKRFAIAGKDKKWFWADAKIDGNTVLVSSPKVKEPVAVRYAYSMNPQGCNLYNKEGLPASPFRTDNW